MADTKISALTAATTPLAGTEVLPIVQSGVTKKVSVASLTSGRSVDVLNLTVATNGYPFIDGNAYYVDSGFAAYITGTSKNGFSSINFYTNSTLRMQIATTSGDVQLVTGNLIQGTAAKGINFTANSAAAGKTSQLLNWYEEGTWTPGKGGGLTVVGTFSSSGTYTRIGRTVFVKGTLSGSTSVAFTGGAVDIANSLPFSTGENALVCWNGNYTATATVITSGTTIYSVTAMAATTSISFSGTYSV